jgi:hypothetical protein
VNTFENVELIFIDNHLERVRALKLDFDNQLELNKFKWKRILRLLKQSTLVEHLELRIFCSRQKDGDEVEKRNEFMRNEVENHNYYYLNMIIDHLISFNRTLRHLSLKKVEYMDTFYIDELYLFEQLFSKLNNLCVFESDFCIFNGFIRSYNTLHSPYMNVNAIQVIRKKKKRKKKL